MEPASPARRFSVSRGRRNSYGRYRIQLGLDLRVDLRLGNVYEPATSAAGTPLTCAHLSGLLPEIGIFFPVTTWFDPVSGFQKLRAGTIS